MFVFRNHTVERFFPKGYSFSGYDDISFIPQDVEGYVWFYQVPVKNDRKLLAEEVESYSGKVEYLLGRMDPSKVFVALTLVPVFEPVVSESDFQLAAAIAGFNGALYRLAQEHANLKVIDFHDFTSRYSATELMDWKYYFISQMGLNPRLSGDFIHWWGKKMDSVALKRKKCIVLDLDNTLWGGVLGEDGMDGIKIGGDYPGKAFAFFQEALLELEKSGVILAVCSKNNEADVLEAWERVPSMVLRKEHFAACRINWQDKAGNIREMARELNIGLDSMVFLDDNPSERELVSQFLPEVAVPAFPEHPYELPHFFQSLVDNFFQVYSVTDEDRNKTTQYQANAARAEAQKQFADYASFLRSLQIQVTVSEADDVTIPRIAQMTQKTNQFNLTTRRYQDSDIRQFLQDGWRIWSISVSDRFGDSGITGCALVHRNDVDSFLLSCRVLGKGIESVFLKTVLSILKKEGCQAVTAHYVPTQKNAQVADFYEKCGFSCVGKSEEGKDYVLELAQADLTVADYYQITIK